MLHSIGRHGYYIRHPASLMPFKARPKHHRRIKILYIFIIKAQVKASSYIPKDSQGPKLTAR